MVLPVANPCSRYAGRLPFGAMPQKKTWADVLTRDFLARETASGRTVGQIAKAVGCTANTVRDYLVRHGLRTEEGERPADNTLAEAYGRLGNIRAVAAHFEVPYSTAREWLLAASVALKKPRPTPPKATFDVDEAARRYAAGEGFPAIAAALDVPVMTLRDRLVAEGRIVPRRRGRPKSAR